MKSSTITKLAVLSGGVFFTFFAGAGISAAELADPVINGDAVALVSEDYTFHIDNLHPETELETWYEIDIYDEEDGGSEPVWEGTKGDYGDETSDFCVPALSLMADHRYRISVWVETYDEEDETIGSSKGAWMIFYAASEMDPGVSISIDGSDHASAYVYDAYTVLVEAPDASAVKFYTGESWIYSLTENGAAEFTWSSREVGTFTHFAVVCHDSIDPDTFDEAWENLNWAGVSGNVTVSVRNFGQVGEAEFTSPETIAKGRPLPVSITSLSDAQRFRVIIQDEQENNLLVDFSDDVDVPVVIDLPTGSLETNTQYYVVVETEADQLLNNSTDKYLHPLRVTEQEQAVNVTLSRKNVKAGEPVSIYVYAPDAMTVRAELLDLDGNVQNEWETQGYYLEDTFDVWNDGTYTIRGYARFDGDDDWVQSEDVHTLNVTTAGTLAIPAQTWPDIVLAGNEIEYFFDAVENAQWYVLTTTPSHGEADILTEVGTHVVSGSQNLTPGVVYTMGINSFAIGYDPGESSGHSVAVVDPAKILVLPSDLTTIESEAFMGIDAQMIVLPESVTTVEARAFAACSNLIAVVSPNQGLQLGAVVFEDCPNEIVIAQSY